MTDKVKKCDAKESEYLDKTFPHEEKGEWYDLTEMLNTCDVVNGCEDCPHGRRLRRNGGGRMTDYISRADAIDAVAQEWLYEASAESPYVNDDDIGEYRKLAEKLFKDVPSADAVQGEWVWRTDIPIGDGRTSAGYICSNCGKDYWHGNVFDFCPNCGARMKGGEDE